MAIRSFFMLMRKSNAVYEKYCRKVIHKWGLNPTSFQVMLFFANYPEYNTARDLCRMRQMKTGIVSVSVDQLCSAGLLERRSDPDDRRIQRLYPTERARPLIQEGKEVQQRYFQKLSQSLTPEELDQFRMLLMKFMDTIDEMDSELTE